MVGPSAGVGIWGYLGQQHKDGGGEYNRVSAVANRRNPSPIHPPYYRPPQWGIRLYIQIPLLLLPPPPSFLSTLSHPSPFPPASTAAPPRATQRILPPPASRVSSMPPYPPLRGWGGGSGRGGGWSRPTASAQSTDFPSLEIPIQATMLAEGTRDPSTRQSVNQSISPFAPSQPSVPNPRPPGGGFPVFDPLISFPGLAPPSITTGFGRCRVDPV